MPKPPLWFVFKLQTLQVLADGVHNFSPRHGACVINLVLCPERVVISGMSAIRAVTRCRPRQSRTGRDLEISKAGFLGAFASQISVFISFHRYRNLIPERSKVSRFKAHGAALPNHDPALIAAIQPDTIYSRAFRCELGKKSPPCLQPRGPRLSPPTSAGCSLPQRPPQ